MKNQYNRARRHNSNNNRSARTYQIQQIFRYTNLDSTGPLGKLRGTALQLAEKYQAAAKDAALQGDDVLMQNCQQYADHYLRLQAIAIENEQALKPKQSSQPETGDDKDVQNIGETVEEKVQEAEPLSPKNESSSDFINESVLPPEVPVE